MSNAELFADMGFDAIFLSASHDYEEPHIWVPDPFNLRQGIFSHVLDQSYSSELEDLQKFISTESLLEKNGFARPATGYVASVYINYAETFHTKHRRRLVPILYGGRLAHRFAGLNF